MRAFAIIFALTLLALPCMAQAAPVPPEQAEAGLRRWFDGQPVQKQEMLKRRLRVFRAMTPEARRQMLKAASEGKPVLTERQQEDLRKLAKLPMLQRVRLFTLAQELEVVRRNMPEPYERAMKAPDREKALYALIAQQRMQMSLTPAERMELRALKTQPEKNEFLRKRREAGEKDAQERIRALEHLNPRLADLKQAAATDEEARREMRQALRDLGTLDMLLQRLPPEPREKVKTEIKGMTVERAAIRVQRELNIHWNAQKGQRNDKRPQREEPPFRNGDRKGIAPRDERIKNAK